jgi:hypothetical protein
VITKQGREHVRFSASAKPDTEDKWRPYRVSGEELPRALLAVVSGLEPAISDEDAEPVDEDE